MVCETAHRSPGSWIAVSRAKMTTAQGVLQGSGERAQLLDTAVLQRRGGRKVARARTKPRLTDAGELGAAATRSARRDAGVTGTMAESSTHMATVRSTYAFETMRSFGFLHFGIKMIVVRFI